MLDCGLDAIVSRISRRRLLIGLLCVALVGFVMADDASCNRTDLAVPRDMARDAPNDGALDASLRLGGGSKRDNQNRGTKDQQLHSGSPKNRRCTNPHCDDWFPNGT